MENSCASEGTYIESAEVSGRSANADTVWAGNGPGVTEQQRGSFLRDEAIPEQRRQRDTHTASTYRARYGSLMSNAR
jgi:hypothetical protein